MTANERRMQILEVLCERRHESVANLAFEFGVTTRTIKSDLLILTCSYPVYTTQGNGGGVHIVDGYRLGKKYMTEQETALLEKLSAGLSGEDLATMQAIIKKFKEPRRK